MSDGIILWCGVAPNQKALANKIHQNFRLSGIVIDEKKITAKKQPLISKIIDKLLFWKIYRSWKSLQKNYTKQYDSWPAVPVFRVPTINDEKTIQFTNKLSPSLIVVSGTSMIKEKLIDLPVSIGIINLHTGLSPYVKGGPNCTNWCIAENNWELVGNTIMWLNKGIDAGNIITSETVDITNSSSLSDAHLRVMEHAHDLYLRTIQYLLTTLPPFSSVAQDQIAKGKLYLNKMWGSKQKRNLLLNWKKREKGNLNKETPATISLP